MPRNKIRSVDDVKVKVTYTEGYRDRFTLACLEALSEQEEEQRLEAANRNIKTS